ncbi:MAG: DUF4393 domain-containing protein [Planctomycetaceae bacterium]|nr:DUF4393 domain-containing protein [Planctomycetaceae bacterium]
MDKDLLQTVSDTLKRPIDTVCKLLENLLDESTKALGYYFSDHVVYWQWCNRLNILEKAQKKLKEKGLTAHKLPNDFVVPLLRECGDSSEDDLQNMWADLLSGAVENAANSHVSYVHTLKTMSSTDVVFISTMLRCEPVRGKERIELVVSNSKLTAEQAEASQANLDRLGFFTPTRTRLKSFAMNFLLACGINEQILKEYKKKEDLIPRRVLSD